MRCGLTCGSQHAIWHGVCCYTSVLPDLAAGHLPLRRRRMKRVLAVLACLAALASGTRAYAQGAQTGTITGTVQSADGLSLPGVTVTASSPALQGVRSSVTDVNGVYVIKGLPPGRYVIAFEMPSFRPATNDTVDLTVGGTAEANQTMSLASVSETVNVIGNTTPTALATVTTS